MAAPNPTLPDSAYVALQDIAQVKNLLNGDTCVMRGDGTPVAERLHEFFLDPVVSEAWETFNRGRPRLR